MVCVLFSVRVYCVYYEVCAVYIVCVFCVCLCLVVCVCCVLSVLCVLDGRRVGLRVCWVASAWKNAEIMLLCCVLRVQS